jgi:putative ABC transport system permease protein
MGAMLAMLIQKQASLLLARDIRILSNPAEIAWGAFIIAVLATLTSIIPAYISSGTKPVDVIKGNARHLDKSILGKLFIGFQAALCMACISVAMTLWMQTEKMIDTPLGYHTENIVHVEGFPMNADAELKAMPFIKRLGHLSNLPIQGTDGGRTIKLGDEKIFISSIYCDTTALSILGIDILESYKEVSPWDFLLTESTAGRLRNICSSKGIPHEQIKSRYSGVTSDIRFGNFSTSSEDFTGIMIADDLGYDPFVVEIIGDPYDAIRKIRECLEDIELDRNYRFELKINTVRDLIEESYIKERNNFILIGIFSFLCIMLTAMAVLALSSHYAQMSAHDTAVRKVFGTSRRTVFWRTVLGFAAPVCAGALIATPITYYHIGRWLEAYTVRIPNSPIIYAAALAILLTVTVASVSAQALRLMRTNPADVLKKE